MTGVPVMGESAALPAQSTWSLLLDRLEHRLRLLEASALPKAEHVEVGPMLNPSDLPAEVPTPEERIRLLALLANHDRAVERLERRRRMLRQAQHYRMGSA